MLTFLLNQSQYVQKDPNVLVGYISQFLGYIMNFFFDIAFYFTEKGSLGIAIILLTIATRLLMFPLSFKSQKSMIAMQKLQPEIEKIKSKYGTSKDPEIQQKMNVEIQALYTKNKINPFGGCLPVIIQFPIFIALSYIMQQSYLFIDKLRGVAYKILEIPDIFNILAPYTVNKIPADLYPFDLSNSKNLAKLLSIFTPENWGTFFQQIPSEYVGQIQALMDQRINMENFFGLNLINQSGWSFPGILIPILAAATTFLSSWVMMRQQKTTGDANMKMQQQIMLVVMPLIMGWTTATFPAGVGLYWITSNVVQFVQQIILNRYYKRD